MSDSMQDLSVLTDSSMSLTAFSAKPFDWESPFGVFNGITGLCRLRCTLDCSDIMATSLSVFMATLPYPRESISSTTLLIMYSEYSPLTIALSGLGCANKVPLLSSAMTSTVSLSDSSLLPRKHRSAPIVGSLSSSDSSLPSISVLWC